MSPDDKHIPGSLAAIAGVEPEGWLARMGGPDGPVVGAGKTVHEALQGLRESGIEFYEPPPLLPPLRDDQAWSASLRDGGEVILVPCTLKELRDRGLNEAQD